MMEVTPGTLAGDNPSTFEDEDIDTGPDAATMTPAQAEADAIEKIAAQPTPPAEPEEKSRKNDPRGYFVLERQEDSDGPFFTMVAQEPVVARNGINAIRKAFKEHIKDEDLHHFVTVPASQFKMIPVQHTKREVGSVSIGA